MIRHSPRPAGSMLVLAFAFAWISAPAPLAAQTTSVSFDASGSWVFLALDDTEGLVNVSDPATSDAWDLAFQGTTVMLNSAGAGPGDVTAACICQNQWATNDELQRMTPDSELADFEAVSGESIPTNLEWSPGTFGTAPWFKYNLVDDHMVWPNYNVYLVKRDDRVYKLQVIGYYDAFGEPRHVTLRYERVAG